MEKIKNVLICEDDPVQLRILTTLIDQAGYRSLAARTPLEALGAARRCGVDAVLADVQLQDGNAFDLLGDLRRMGLDAPVFMASAYATEGMKERARAAGARFFFDKPFNLSAIRTRMDEALKAPRMEESKLLLLENHPGTRSGLEKMSADAGFEVLATDDSGKALDLLRSQGDEIEILLLDLHAQGSSADALIRKSLEIAPHLHVVAMSGDAVREEIRGAYEAGAASFIRKPVAEEQFRHILKASLKAARRNRESAEEHRMWRERLAAEPRARKFVRWVKSYVYAPSGSRKSQRRWATALCALGLSYGIYMAIQYRNISEVFEKFDAMHERVMQMSASRPDPMATRQEAVLRQAQSAEQLHLMRDSNEFTRRYYQDYIQEMRWQGSSQKAQPSVPQTSEFAPVPH